MMEKQCFGRGRRFRLSGSIGGKELRAGDHERCSSVVVSIPRSVDSVVHAEDSWSDMQVEIAVAALETLSAALVPWVYGTSVAPKLSAVPLPEIVFPRSWQFRFTSDVVSVVADRVSQRQSAEGRSTWAIRNVNHWLLPVSAQF